MTLNPKQIERYVTSAGNIPFGDSQIILLFCGGDKSTQNQDIRQSQQYWRNYEKRHSNNL